MELLVQLLPKIMITAAFLGFFSMLINIYDTLIRKPGMLRSKLRKQGIRGPPPSFLLGNIGEMRKNQPRVSLAAQVEGLKTHNCSSFLFPAFDQWRKEYGSLFLFALGTKQILHINEPDVVRQISICTSMDIGKPSYQSERLGPLLGRGILTSNGAIWAHQRRILAPELYPEKVKGMSNLMVESAMIIVNSWSNEIESAGGIADINVDEYARSFSGDVISRACFGSNYSKGEKIFKKLRSLQEAISKKVFSKIGIPGMRYFPTKSNREIWRLEKEVRELILKVVKERKESKPENDLLQSILENATSCDLGEDQTMGNFIVDNCKNIYLAGYETTAVTAEWVLMLLALNPDWQTRVRKEVVEACGGQLPDAKMLRSMKTLTMVINETLRLYPPVAVMSREALQDIKFGEMYVPKGVYLWTLIATLHQDPEIWGCDANEFNPERFANGVTGACKLPHLYMPFGGGSRTCLGQNFAMTELRILIALLLSNFKFSLSPTYKHRPTLRLVIEPQHGVNLLIERL